MKRFANTELARLHKTIVGINMGFVALILVGVLVSVLGVQAWMSAQSINEALSKRVHDQIRMMEMDAQTSASENVDAPAAAGSENEQAISGDITPQKEGEANPNPIKDKPGHFEGGPMFIAASTVQIPNENSPEEMSVVGNGLDVAESTLSEYASQALATGETSGFIENGSVVFVRGVFSDGTQIISFGSTSYITETLKNLAVTLIGVIIVAFLACFLVSWMVAKRAVRPIEDAWKSERQFISDASHELKTPLTVILANLALIKDAPQERISSQMHWIDSTESEAKHMQSLVSDMLELSRTELIETDIIRVPVDVSVLLKKSLLQFESVAYERGISFETDIPASLSSLGDAELLARLFALLLDNACKYTTNNEVRVCATMSGSQVHLTFQNEGKALSSEDVAHIFDRFYRSDKSRNEQTGGAGLGLALAKRICDVHQGSISMKCDEISDERALITLTVLLPYKHQ